MSGYNKNKKTPSQRLIINTIRTFITCYNHKEIYFSIAITRDVEESKKKIRSYTLVYIIYECP
jgi:hypothetical protein